MKKTFEKSLRRLIEIADALEGDDASLDKTLALYNEGVKLSKQCGATLARCEAEVLVLQKEADAAFTLAPFDAL